MKYRSWIASVGTLSPQVQIQITPLMWGVEFGIGEWSVGAKVGPIAIRAWFGYSAFRMCRNSKTYYPFLKCSHEL